ncbi:RidA family protein [Candidatus Solirubrobacter pratensis]|uniref:RidA family protein n=1 Tax=Candidatus Solirubrobacter pratensis TaxID=1298857 RepID=UPI00041D507C|nr:RidA family protein [Candidatus Solirubrobacter pratensis]
MTPEERLRHLGIELPEMMIPAGSYLPARVTGDLIFVSGQGPWHAGGLVKGKVGRDLTGEQAREAARLTGLNLLAVLRRELGSLDRVGAIVKVLGMVNCAPGFNDTPAVINGCSDLLVEVFGEAGKHARSAVGMAELPFDIAVEIELVAEVVRPGP